MSPDEYQALIIGWLDDLSRIRDRVEDLTSLPDLLSQESYDEVNDVKHTVEELISSVDRYAWPDARGIRDRLFQDINEVARIDILKAESAVAKAEERLKIEVNRQTAELARGFEARLRLHQEEHEKRWKELQEQDRERRKEHRAAMSRIEAEIERRVEQRITGKVEDVPRPRRPLRIG